MSPKQITPYIKGIAAFVLVGLFLLSFFVDTGPLAQIRELFIAGYDRIPGRADGFGLRDLFAFTVVYVAWYVLFSIASYLAYSVKRTLLLRKAEKEYAESHGMLPDDGDDEGTEN